MKTAPAVPHSGMFTAYPHQCTEGGPQRVRQSLLQPSLPKAHTSLPETITQSSAGLAVNQTSSDTLITQFNNDESTTILVSSLGMAMEDASFKMTTFLKNYFNRRACHFENRKLNVKPKNEAESFSTSLMYPASKVGLFFGTRPQPQNREDQSSPRLKIRMGFILGNDVKITNAFPGEAGTLNRHFTTVTSLSSSKKSPVKVMARLTQSEQGKLYRDKHFKIINGDLSERSTANTLKALRNHHLKHCNPSDYTEVLVTPGEDPNQCIHSFFIDLCSDVPPMDTEQLNQTLAEYKGEIVEFETAVNEVSHYQHRNKAGEVQFDISIDPFPLTVIYNDIASGRRKIAYMAFDQNGTPVTSETRQLNHDRRNWPQRPTQRLKRDRAPSLG